MDLYGAPILGVYSLHETSSPAFLSRSIRRANAAGPQTGALSVIERLYELEPTVERNRIRSALSSASVTTVC